MHTFIFTYRGDEYTFKLSDVSEVVQLSRKLQYVAEELDEQVKNQFRDWVDEWKAFPNCDLPRKGKRPMMGMGSDSAIPIRTDRNGLDYVMVEGWRRYLSEFKIVKRNTYFFLYDAADEFFVVAKRT